MPLTPPFPELLSPDADRRCASLPIRPQPVVEKWSEGRREGAASLAKAGRERQEGGRGVGKEAPAETRSEKTGGRDGEMPGVRRGRQDGEAGPGGGEGLGTRGPGPHSPRSSMTGRGQTARGEQGGGRVRWGRGAGGRPGAGGPAVTM